MCLTSVQKKFPINDKMVVGYKVYKKTSKKRVYKDKFRHFIRKEGLHYKAKGSIIIGTKFGKEFFYDAGFHIYSSKKEAFKSCFTNEIVCKVLCWDIRAIGCDKWYGKSRVYIAKNIRIMEEIKK